MNIQEFRQKYPEYDDMSDQQLADSFHQKYYADIPIKEFNEKFLVQPAKVMIEPTPVMDKAAPILEQIRKGLTKQLPVAGMMFGGALGGVPGAALGAGIGQAGQGLIERMQGEPITSKQNIMDIAKAIPSGAMAEMGGQIFGKVAEKAFAPGRKWLTDQIANVEMGRAAEQMAAQGIPISPKTIAPSMPARAVHWLAERFQPGKSIVDSYRKQTMDMLMQMRRDVVEDLGLPAVGSMPFGASQETIKGVFSQFKNAAGPKAEIPLPNAQAFVNQIDEAAVVGKVGKEYLESLKGQLQPGVATVEQIERINAGLWPKGKAYGKMAATEKAWREEFLQNLYKDLGAQEENLGINLATLLQSAKGTTRQIKQAEYLESLLDKATNNELMQFNPQRFYDLVSKNQNQILKRFDKDQATNVFAFAEKMRAVAPERALFKSGQEPTNWWEQSISSGLPLGLIGGGYAMSPAMAIPVGFQAIVARSLMAPKGVVRKWLTTGYRPPQLPGKVGLMELQEMSE